MAAAGGAPPGGVTPSRIVASSEWEQLVQDFRTSAESRAKWMSQFASPSALLDQALQLVTSRKDSSLKLQILAFIDENASIFIADPASTTLLLDALRSITLQLPASTVEPSASTSTWLREQMMVTVTSAVVCNHESVPREVLASLVEMLLSFVNRPNHSSDRHLRATACECLRELELANPCLLHSSAGHLLVLCQAERTHAGQAYTLLLTTILRNLAIGMEQVRSYNGSSYSILSTSIPLVPFSVPPFLNDVNDVNTSRYIQPDFSDDNIKDLRRVISFLLERPNLLTEFVLSEFISDLSDIAVLLDLQPSLLKLQFWRLLQAYSPVSCHALLTIFTRFPDAFEGDEVAIYKRLVLFCDEYAQPLTIRLLAMHWLVGMEDVLVSRDKHSILPQVSSGLYPQVFDPLSLKAGKLGCLARCAAVLDKQQLRTGVDDASKLFNDGLVCLSAYKWLPLHSTETRLMFNVLHRFLIAGWPHPLKSEECIEESQLFGTLQGTMVTMARNVRTLVFKILALLDRFLGCKTHEGLGRRILRTFSEELIPVLPSSLHLPAYFCLMERIAEDKRIPPSALIESLDSYLKRRVAADSGNESARLWLRGSEVLAICRILLMHHQSSRVFHKLQALLGYLCLEFPDIEVRDSARFYLRMLVSVPGKRLREVLLHGDDKMEDSKPQLLSSLLSSPSPRAYKGAQQSGKVSSYIFLLRESPLLVQSSWSLVVHESFEPALKVIPESSNGNATSEASEVDATIVTEAAANRLTSGLENLPRMMDSKTIEVLNVLRRHFSEVPEAGLKVQVSCRLGLKLEPLEPQEQGQQQDEYLNVAGIYGVVISFSTTGTYGPIPSVRVPFLLSLHDPVSSSSNGDDKQVVVHHLDDKEKLVKIELEPKQPAPALVDCHIVFSDEDAQTVQGQLDSIAVGIEDLFMKPPIPASLENRAEYRYNLFNALWYGCSGPGKLGSEVFLLQGGRQGLGIQGSESVKLMEAQADRIVSAVETYLAEFVVAVGGATVVGMVRDSNKFRDVHWMEDESSRTKIVDRKMDVEASKSEISLDIVEVEEAPNEKGERGCFLVLIFLPPRYHLLLRMEVSDWFTLVRIRTDYWPTLAHIDEFLESFMVPRTEF